MNNKQHNTEENEILALIDARMHDEQVSTTGKTTEDYKELLELLADSRTSITPSPEALRALLANLPTTSASLPFEQSQSIKSPYRGVVNWLYAGTSSTKFATPFIVVLFAVAVIIGASPRKGMAPLSVTPPATDEVISVSTSGMVAENPSPALFSVTEDAVPAIAPRAMLMSKMSQTTVPSTTPQNVGQLIALLSSEADGDVDLGITDVNDPLLSVDPASVDAIQLSYDIQTI